MPDPMNLQRDQEPNQPQVVNNYATSELKGCLSGLLELITGIILIIAMIIFMFWVCGGTLDVKQDCTKLQVPKVIQVDTCTPR